MKRTVLLSVLLLAALATTLALSIPRPLHAIKCCDYSYNETSQYWTMKSTCAEAEAEHRSLSFPEAQAACSPDGVCLFELPPCYQDGNMWVVDGRATFSCRSLICGPFEPEF